MAFSSSGWNVIGAAKKGNAPSMYTYTSADAIATVNTSGYFNDLSDTLAVGDIIFVHDSATPTMNVIRTIHWAINAGRESSLEFTLTPTCLRT